MADNALQSLQIFIGLSDAISMSGTIAWLPEEILQDLFIAAPTGQVRDDWMRSMRTRDSVIFGMGVS